MSSTVLVAGGTGTVGRHVAKALAARGVAARIGSRRGEAGRVRLDYADPAGFDAALAGVDAAYVISPTGELDPDNRLGPFIGRAAARGVKLVLQTAIGVDADDAIPLRRLERRLQASGTRHVILRPNWFTDNFLTYWGAGIRAAGEIAVPAGNGASSFVDARDIAEVAAAVLTSDDQDGQALAVTGGEALTYAEVADLLGAAVGRPVRYRPSEAAAFIAQMVGMGMDEAYAGMLAAIFGPVAAGWTAAVSPVVEQLTGRQPRSVADFVREHAAAWRA